MTWISKVQHSVALESYLDNFKAQLAEIKIINPNNNLSRNEVKALKELKNNPAINLKKKKTNKGTTTVIMNKADKIYEDKVQLDNRKHYERLKAPTVKTTQEKVNNLINQVHQGEHIDDMTKKLNGFYKLPIRLEYQYYTQLQKSTNLTRLVDASSRVVTALLNKYIHFWIHCSSLSHRNN